jgi:hypothetical protein
MTGSTTMLEDVLIITGIFQSANLLLQEIGEEG